jgi:hypothetical protein
MVAEFGDPMTDHVSPEPVPKREPATSEMPVVKPTPKGGKQ